MSKLARHYSLNLSFSVRYLSKRCEATLFSVTTLSLLQRSYRITSTWISSHQSSPRTLKDVDETHEVIYRYRLNFFWVCSHRGVQVPITNTLGKGKFGAWNMHFFVLIMPMTSVPATYACRGVLATITRYDCSDSVN